MGDWACGLSQKQEGDKLEEKVGTKGGFLEEWGVLSRGKEEEQDTNRHQEMQKMGLSKEVHGIYFSKCRERREWMKKLRKDERGGS